MEILQGIIINIKENKNDIKKNKDNFNNDNYTTN